MTAENNQIPGWKYYNHAAIPTCAPHEMPDLTPVKDGSIWHIEGKNPLLVRYTTDWDCGYDTGWWYLIKEAPFDITYKEQHFGYRKCYCRLHILYRPFYNLIFKVLFLLRGIISALGSRCTLTHRIVAVLKMEEIARKSCRRDS